MRTAVMVDEAPFFFLFVLCFDYADYLRLLHYFAIISLFIAYASVSPMPRCAAPAADALPYACHIFTFLLYFSTPTIVACRLPIIFDAAAISPRATRAMMMLIALFFSFLP